MFFLCSVIEISGRTGPAPSVAPNLLLPGQQCAGLGGISGCKACRRLRTYRDQQACRCPLVLNVTRIITHVFSAHVPRQVIVKPMHDRLLVLRQAFALRF